MLTEEQDPNCVSCHTPLTGQEVIRIDKTRSIHAVCQSLISEVASMTLEDMPDEVIFELTDERFINRTHYKRATYALGCHGPLCRKSERDRGLERQRDIRGTKRDDTPETKAREDDAILNKCIAWHLQQRLAPKEAE
jgi:hypothetical protein